MSKNIDWDNLGFGYVETDYRYLTTYKDGKWDEGSLITDSNVVLNECAGVFQYAQTIFEGLKVPSIPGGKLGKKLALKIGMPYYRFLDKYR